MEKFRELELQRLLKWISENSYKWEKICDTSDELEDEECLNYLETMKEESFYAIMLLLLTNCYSSNKLFKVVEKFKGKALIEYFDRYSAYEVFTEICEEYKRII